MPEVREVRVVVKAGAKKERFEFTDGRFMICVRERAERNEANTRVRELLADYFGIPAGAVRIIRGHRSLHKTLAVTARPRP